MSRSATICAAAIAFALCAALGGGAVAQSQMQGQTMGSEAPSAKPKSAKEIRADCTSKGKDQGLKGRDLTNFVNTCVKN